MRWSDGRAEMDLTVTLIGLAVLVGLAVIIGLAQSADRGARNRAWRGIAAERRRCWEERQRLQQLTETIQRCRNCPFRRRTDR